MNSNFLRLSNLTRQVVLNARLLLRVVLYVLPFKFGLCFPFPHFIRAFFSYFDLAFVQLIPECWMKIFTIQILENIYGFRLYPCMLLKWYHVKENTHKSFRYMLNVCRSKNIFFRAFLGDKN